MTIGPLTNPAGRHAGRHGSGLSRRQNAHWIRGFMTFQLARHGAGPVGGRGRGGLGSRIRGRVLKRQALMRNLLRSRSCGEPPRASQAGGKRASVRDVLRALTGAYRGKASRGKRSTATRGVPHDESGDGEETHREWLAWLSLRPDPFGQHRPPGLRKASRLAAIIRPACRGFAESVTGRSSNARLS